MTVTTTYKRLKTDTVNGARVQIINTYSSYNPEEIDTIEEGLKERVGAGIVTEYKAESEDKR